MFCLTLWNCLIWENRLEANKLLPQFLTKSTKTPLAELNNLPPGQKIKRITKYHQYFTLTRE